MSCRCLLLERSRCRKCSTHVGGATNGRNAAPGTIRGDYSMSVQENIVHASDSQETAAIELKRFFNDDELFNYETKNLLSLYANDEF